VPLIAEDFGIGAGDHDTHEAAAVEEEIEFEIVGFDAKLVHLLTVRILSAQRFNRNDTGR